MKATGSFTKYFPPPRYLTPKRAGLAISEEAVRMVLFGGKKEAPVLLHYAEEKLPEGVVSGGEMKNKEVLKEVIKKFHKTYGVRFARVSVPERKAYIVKAELTKDKASNLRDLVEMNLGDFVPMSPSEAVFDYEVIRTIPPKCERVELQIGVIHKDVVSEYLGAFEGTGITLSSIEIEAQAVARSVVPKDDQGAFMIVDFEFRRTGIYMVKRGIVGFTTTIDMGGETLEKILHDKFDLKKEEIADLKEKFNCVEHGVNEEDEKLAVFMSFISEFCSEVGHRLEYWRTQEGSADEQEASQKIILTGSESGLRGLGQYLSGNLGVHVEVGNVWNNIFDFEKHIPEIHHRDSLGYSAAVGLALIEGV